MRRTFDMATFATYMVTAGVAFALLLALHHSFMAAFIAGIAWGAVPQGLAWGLAELIAPGSVIRWRHKLLAGDGDIRKPVGDYFSRLFATTGPEPWESNIARRRVRALGVGLTAFWLACIALLLWIPPFLDAHLPR
jgi:hypothetical protein